MTIHAYLRISTSDKGQSTENQKLAIVEAGYAVHHWYAEEGVSGSVKALERPEFVRLMEVVTSGDSIIVTALDRLGRDAEDILNTVNAFVRMKVRVCILNLGNLDVTSVSGKMFLTILSALAEMERGILRERTKQGMARVAAEGVFVGRPLAISPELMKVLMAGRESGATLEYLSQMYSVNKMTLQRNLKKWKGKLPAYTKEYNERLAQYEAKQG